MVKKNTQTKTIGIPEPSIRRLPLYLSYARTIDDRKNITAPQIARALNLDSTQVTKDISFTGIIGKTRVGYDINQLITGLEEFLGYNKKNEAFLIGAGNLGSALIKYKGFEDSGLKIIAAFDIDEQKIGKQFEGIEVLAVSKFENLAERMHIRIGILTVPSEYAQEYADMMISCGIKAIWNFTPVPINAPEDIIIENTSIYSNLAVIINKLNQNK